MWSIVWQLVVLPGTQTVTLVNSVLTLLACGGPPSITTLATLLVGGVPPPPVPPPPAAEPPPPPPPQAAAERITTALNPVRSARSETISANLPGSRRWEWRSVNTLDRKARACDRHPRRLHRPAESEHGGDPRAWIAGPMQKRRNTGRELGVDRAESGPATRPRKPCRPAQRIRASPCPTPAQFRALDNCRDRPRT